MWAKIRQVFLLCSLQGISIKPLVRFLQINLQEEKDLKLSEEINSHVSRGIYQYTENKLLLQIIKDREILPVHVKYTKLCNHVF